MANVNLYFYIEDLGLNTGQWDTIINQLQQLGQRNQDGNPKNRNHWRVRLDSKAVIFEGWFDDTQLTEVALRNRLAVIFGVAQTSITYSITQVAYGPVVTYTYSSQQKLRVGVFGGATATYAESQTAALAYLAANVADWQSA